MPVIIQFGPLLKSKATVDISPLLNSLRAHSNQSQRLADSLEQLQSIIYVILRELRSGVSITGDQIQIPGAGGEVGAQFTADYANVKTEYRINEQLVLRTGNGDPNGVVTASPGALYTNTAGGANLTLWVKESGTATNTGWVAK
jgi:hypothetical protein